MHRDSIQPRPRGTGSLLRHTHKSGCESWYGKWWADGRQVMRCLGPVRPPRSRQGLTRSQAEAALRQAIEASRTSRRLSERIDLAEAGRRYLANREAIGLKPGTLADYESFLRVHLLPHLGRKPLDQISPEDVEAFIAAERQAGSAVKSILNYLGLLHAILAHAVKRGWCTTQPGHRGRQAAPAAQPARSATSPSPSSRRSSPTPPTTRSAAPSTSST